MHCCKVNRPKNWHLEGAKILLGNSDIPRTKSTRIMGVLFDCKFNLHTKQDKEDCKNHLNSYINADRRTLLYIENATVTSKLFYGMEIFRKENLENLAPIYNQNLRIASDTLRMRPILPLAVEPGFTFPASGHSFTNQESMLRARKTFQRVHQFVEKIQHSLSTPYG